jgi:O-antigen ligase
MSQAMSTEKFRFVLTTGVCLALFYAIAFSVFGFDHRSLLVLMVLSATPVLLLSFDLALLAFLGSLFAVQDVSIFKVVVPCGLLLVAAFLFTHRSLQRKDFTSPVSRALVVFLLTMMPSLVNSPSIPRTLLYMVNSLAFAGVVFVLSAGLDTLRKITIPLTVFGALVLANSVFVVGSSAFEKGRLYGIPGVVYVDFVVMMIILCIVLVFYSRKFVRYAAVCAVILGLVGLVLTQTRNTAISLVITLVMLLGYLLRQPWLVGMNRKRLVTIGVTFAAIGIVAVGLTLALAPQVLYRTADISRLAEYEMRTPEDFALNSFVTRSLIWITAYDAFRAHPFIGIGALSFPFAAREYFTIPPVLFNRFVSGYAPHITYLSVLAETGLVGLAGFIYLVWVSVRTAFASVRLSKTPDDRRISMMLASVQLYIPVSMFLTDAWLWGQCGMLWALILGLTTANYLRLTRESELVEYA